MLLHIFKINYGILRVKCLDLKCFNQRSFDIYSSATHAFIKVEGFLNLRKFSYVPSQSCSTAPLNHSTPVLISVTMKALLDCDISVSQMDYLGTFDKNHLTVRVVFGTLSCPIELFGYIFNNTSVLLVHMCILQARILEWVAMPYSWGIFPTQGSSPGLPYLPHCKWILYPLSHLGAYCSFIESLEIKQ